MDPSIEKDLEKVKRLVHDEQIHCLVMAAKIFADLANWFDEFFATKSKAKLTIDELLDFKRQFKWMGMAFLTVMADRIENHKFVAKIKNQQVFCTCRSN